MLITMSLRQMRHAGITGIIGRVPIYKSKPASVQSTVDQMWFRISIKIYSNSTRVRTVHEKNGSNPVPDFTTTISADPGPDSIYRADAPASPGRPHILI